MRQEVDALRRTNAELSQQSEAWQAERRELLLRLDNLRCAPLSSLEHPNPALVGTRGCSYGRIVIGLQYPDNRHAATSLPVCEIPIIHPA